PHLGDVPDAQIVAALFRKFFGIRVKKDVETFGVGLHQPVFDPVVNHLDEMTGACWTAVEVTLLRGCVRQAGRARDTAAAGRECAKDRLQVIERRFVATDHEAIASFCAPDATAGPSVQIMDATYGEKSGPANVVFVVRIATVNDGVTRFQPPG